jgi:hypothetical protein
MGVDEVTWTQSLEPFGGGVGASAAVTLIPIVVLFALIFLTRTIYAAVIAVALMLLIACGACVRYQRKEGGQEKSLSTSRATIFRSSVFFVVARNSKDARVRARTASPPEAIAKAGAHSRTRPLTDFSTPISPCSRVQDARRSRLPLCR